MSATSTIDPGAAGGRARAVARRGSSLVHHPLLRVVAYRLLLSIPLLFLVSALVFLLTSLVPGDAAVQILGPEASLEQYAQLRRELALDQPLLQQYGSWLGAALQGDLGTSIVTGQSVSDVIFERLPVTISLVVGTLLVSIVVGTGLGIVSAVRGGLFGRAVDVLATAGLVIPVFWLAAELIVIFAVNLGWFPATGYVPFADSPADWFRSLVLPVAALAAGAIARLAKFTREAMLDALGSEYVRMARANGVAPASIVFRHAFKTASVQVVTLAGIVTISLLISTVFVETVFGLPGLGSLMVTAVKGSDLTMVQGVAVFFTLIVVVVNLAVDLLYTLLNPKVRVG